MNTLKRIKKNIYISSIELLEDTINKLEEYSAYINETVDRPTQVCIT
jgi:hypothetical protein